MQKESSVSVWSYVIGFVLAVSLTLLAYWLTVSHVVSGVTLVASIMGLGTIQLVVQLVFFLHLGKGKDARWNVAAFFFMLMILLVIVIGSLWIMYHMNYNMMSADQMDAFMKAENKSGGF